MEKVTFYLMLIAASWGLLGLELALRRVNREGSSSNVVSILRLPMWERYLFTGLPFFLGGVLGFVFVVLDWVEWMPWLAIAAMAASGYLSATKTSERPEKHNDPT